MRWSAAGAAVLLAACGRLGFDPLEGTSNADGAGRPETSVMEGGLSDAGLDGAAPDARADAARGDASSGDAGGPFGDAARDARVDGTSGDAGTSGGGEDAGPHPLPPACEEAIEVAVDAPVEGNNCDGADRLDGCGPEGASELVFRFTAPASGSYMFRNRTEEGVTFSTGLVDSTCTGVASCGGILSRGLEEGETLYFVVEDPGGGCIDFSFHVE